MENSGELLKLGVDIGQTSVAKYMVRRRGPPSQGWRTFPSAFFVAQSWADCITNMAGFNLRQARVANDPGRVKTRKIERQRE
jgi:hypothetical protein